MDDADLLPTRRSLLIRIRDPRDATSWQTFVEAYAPLIYGYGRRRGLQDADAADLTQEVLTEVARCIRSFEYQPDRGRFRDWLGTVTHRRLARFLGKQSRAKVVDEAASDAAAARPCDPEWADAFGAHLLALALERARPRFEPTTWRAFELTWQCGRPASEVASELNMPVASVYVAKSRVLKRLEDEVRDLADDVPSIVPLH
jgi:RNA polymerase sigma-70 factor (ECF subfamily)